MDCTGEESVDCTGDAILGMVVVVSSLVEGVRRKQTIVMLTQSP